MKFIHTIAWCIAPLISAILPSTLNASETDLAAMLALGDLTSAPAIYDVDGNATTWSAVTTAASSSAQSIYYDGIDYLGNPTRVFAVIGLPSGASSTNQVPGVVLVHGGGGTVISAWVDEWTARGYAAISMDNEGGNLINGVKTKPHAYGGPARTGIYKDSEPENLKPLDEQWEYHATSTIVLANSLMRSLPEVDADKVGVMGVSWGGVLTSAAIGVDNRFAFAIPTYGCGRLFDVGNQYGRSLNDNVFYRTVLDPILRMDLATMPVLWYSWPGESNFSLDSIAATYYAGTSSERMVSLVPDMGHGHGAAYSRPESYDFADSVINTSSPWAAQQSQSLTGSAIEVVFTSTKALYEPTLIYTTGTGFTGELTWPEVVADSIVESPVGTWTIHATLPAGANAWFVNVKAAATSGYRDTSNIMTSDYQEIIEVSLAPSDQLLLDLGESDTASSANVSLSYTAPTNLEVTSIEIIDESEAGAFSVSPSTAFVLGDTPPVVTTFQVQFDNTVAGLNSGETSTGTLVITWEEVDGSSSTVSLPLSATVLTSTTVIYDTTSNWSSESVTGVDDVIIRNGATVTLDQLAQAGSLTVSDEGTPSSAQVLINQDLSLKISNAINLGSGTGSGSILQSDGTVTASDLIINTSGTGDTSSYILSGGNLSTSGSFEINANGSFELNGGTLTTTSSAFPFDGTATIDGGSWLSSGLSLTGSGAFILKSGTVSMSGEVLTGIDLIEISGGSIDFGTAQVQIGKSGSTEFRVIGDDASIQMYVLNQQNTRGKDGTFNFVFDETGISPIQVTQFLHLAAATVVVDGTNYTGGAASFILIDSTNLVTLGDLNNFTATGFADHGLQATFEQDQSNGTDWLQLILTEIPTSRDPIAIWSFDDGIGGTASDSSDNGFNGTVDGATWVGGRSNGALEFNGSTSTVTLSSDTFAAINQQISIAMWAYGGNNQPQPDSVFRAQDASENRVLNIHLPWSNSSIYWDAGNDGASYDRIQKTTSDIKGAWNHWVFTKNATTGEMGIYLNGVLWHSDTGKTLPISNIDQAQIGSAIDDNYYSGTIDEVRLYPVSLTDTEVSDLYHSYTGSGYGAWLLEHSNLVDASLTGDPDQDGIETVLEYVLDGDPEVQDTLILPKLDAEGANFVFTFTRVVDSSTDTTQVFEYGSDLSNTNAWNSLNITEPTATEVELGSELDGVQSVTVTVSKTVAVDNKLFGRLKVMLP